MSIIESDKKGGEMSRGRKAKSSSGLDETELFKQSRSNYFYLILKKLGEKKTTLTNQTSSKLYEELKIEKNKISRDKDLLTIKLEEIPFEIPKNWNWCRLGELFQIERGSSPRPKGDPRYFSAERTNHHWIKISDISAYSEEGILSNTNEFLTDEGTQYGRYVTTKDLIVAVSGSVGKCCLLGIYGYIYDGFLAIKNIENEILKRFLYNLFKYFEKQLLEKATGAIWQNINTDIAKNQLIPLPPIAEQEMILDFLDDFENDNLKENKIYFDGEIENDVKNLFQNQLLGNNISTELTHQLDLVKKLRQQFLQEAVQGKLTGVEDSGLGIEETGAALLERIKAEKAKSGKKEKPLPPIKEEEIPFDIPDNWVWCRLGDVVNHIFDGPFGSHLKSSDYTSSGVQVIRLENLGEMKFKHEKQTFVSHKKYETISQHRVYEGDIIIGSFLADGVKCVVLPPLENITIAKADCFCIRINHTLLLKNYIQFLLTSKPMFLELSSLLRGMTRLRINTTQLKSLPIPLPPLSIQAQIVAKVEELMGLCDALEASIQDSKGVNEALLQQVLREALAG